MHFNATCSRDWFFVADHLWYLKIFFLTGKNNEQGTGANNKVTSRVW